MKRAGVVAGAVLLLAVTGCSQTPQDAAEAPSTVQSTTPLVAEDAAPEPANVEQAYLEEIRATLPKATAIPNATDQQLIDAGTAACAELKAGSDTLTLSLIEGEHADASGYYPDSAAIITAAARTLCG